MKSDLGGPNTINYMEVMGESRGFQISRKSVSKRFVFIIQSEMFVQEGLDNASPLPGTNADMVFDDKRVQISTIGVFWSLVPLVHIFWVRDDYAILLFAADMEVRQLNWSTWRIEITYDIPDDNGSNTQTGNGGGDSGPSNGEQNSQKYTQVSFNGSVGTKTIQMATVLETHVPLVRASSSSPYVQNKPGLIGVSDDEVAGAEVYKREFRFQITQYLPPSRITYQYVRRLSRLITCINAQPFFGFAPGSVMFVGYNGQSDLYEAVPITLEFEYRPNFKFLTGIDTDTPANPNDVFTYPGGVPTVDYSQQFDTYGESAFPSTSRQVIPGMGAGVHSGWSIVAYEFRKKIETPVDGAIVRLPSLRTIYQHYQYQNFEEFLL